MKDVVGEGWRVCGRERGYVVGREGRVCGRGRWMKGMQ